MDTDNERGTWAVLAAVGAALLIYGSLVPFHFRAISFSDAIGRFQALFHLTVLRWGETADWSLNLTIMIPIAFLTIGAVFDGRSKWLVVLAAPGVIIACLGLSLGVEFAQLWSAGRVASARDVVAQTLGACVGVVVWLIIGRRFSAWHRSLAALREPPHKFVWMLQAYVLGLMIYSVVPVDLIMSPAELSEKYRAGLIELVPFSFDRGGALISLYGALTDMLLFIPVGMLAATAWNPQDRKRRTAPQALLVGAFIAIGIELVQLLVVSRYSSSTDVIMGFAGVALGVAIMQRWRNEDRRPVPAEAAGYQISAVCCLGAIAYVVLLALLFWMPFDFTGNTYLIRERLDDFLEIPFARMHQGGDLPGIFGALRKVLWFVPLGVMCGAATSLAPIRSTYRAGIVGIAILAIMVTALAIELGQVLLPDKVADSTDVLLSASGGIAGLIGTVFVVRQGKSPFTRSNFRRPSQVQPIRRHLRGLNGLRAIACLAVFGVHFQQSTGISGHLGSIDFKKMLENGNTGVALFFVLSGFLLALPLWSRPASTRASDILRGFTSKRIVRILPAYLLCLTVLVLVKRHWRSLSELQDTALHYFFLHNYSPTAFYAIDSPFWTVAVQMQFYLVFGMLVWISARTRLTSNRSLLVIFALGCVGSYFLHVSVMNSVTESQREYWGPVLSRSVLAHLPLFFLGVITAFLFVMRRDSSRQLSRSLGIIRDAILVISLVVLFLILSTRFDDWFQIPYGRYNLPYVPLLLAVTIYVTPDSRIALQFLELAPIRLLGVISYGFFLFHLPVMGLVSRVMAFADKSPHSNVLIFASASLLFSLAAASVSYVLIERPLLTRITEESRR